MNTGLSQVTNCTDILVDGASITYTNIGTSLGNYITAQKYVDATAAPQPLHPEPDFFDFVENHICNTCRFCEKRIVNGGEVFFCTKQDKILGVFSKENKLNLIRKPKDCY